MYITGQSTREHDKLLQNVYYMSHYYRTYTTGQTTTECTLHVKPLQDVYQMLKYYRTYITGQATTECTLHVKLLQDVY